jgi:hypothetical protein
MIALLAIDWRWVGGILAFWALGPILFIGVVYWAGLRAEEREERRAATADVIEIGHRRTLRERAARNRHRGIA